MPGIGCGLLSTTWVTPSSCSFVGVSPPAWNLIIEPRSKLIGVRDLLSPVGNVSPLVRLAIIGIAFGRRHSERPIWLEVASRVTTAGATSTARDLRQGDKGVFELGARLTGRCRSTSAPAGRTRRPEIDAVGGGRSGLGSVGARAAACRLSDIAHRSSTRSFIQSRASNFSGYRAAGLACVIARARLGAR